MYIAIFFHFTKFNKQALCIHIDFQKSRINIKLVLVLLLSFKETLSPLYYQNSGTFFSYTSKGV